MIELIPLLGKLDFNYELHFPQAVMDVRDIFDLSRPSVPVVEKNLMTYKKVLKVAIVAIDKEKRQYAFDANLSKKGFGGVGAERALKRYDELEQAKRILQDEEL